jgi:NitT/TauT family transport system ATP-binding protein
MAFHPDNAGVPAPALTRGEGARVVRAGFVPLIDIAVLVAAKEIGFAAREGVTLELVRDVSWSNIRDRLAFRQFDVAHMLSPMPVAAMLGIGSNPYPSFTPFALGRGGNAITLSLALYRRMQEEAGLSGAEDALTNARALKVVIDARRARGEPPLVLAMTYPFSSHNYEFRFWMAAGGIHPDRDVIMTVVPPPLAPDALASGAIDGFCVNAPWNMAAVEAGVGRIVATKADVWPSAPEKVLGVRPDWAEANPETLSRLIVALDAAARWCDVPENRPELAIMLADAAYVGAPSEAMDRLLKGDITVDPDGRIRSIPDYFSFHRRHANVPRVSQAMWIYSQMVRWGQVAANEDNEAVAAAAWRPDLYRTALGAPSSSGEATIEGSDPSDAFLDGRSFDPSRVADYIDGFSIRTDAGAGLPKPDFC